MKGKNTNKNKHETESDPATKPPRAVAYALEAAAVVRLAARVETDGAALLPPYVNVELTPILPLNKLVTVIKLGGLALRAAYIYFENSKI